MKISCFFLACIFLLPFQASHSSSSRQRSLLPNLVTNLFKNYDKNFMPPPKLNKTIEQVFFSLQLLKIISLEAKTRVFVAELGVIMAYDDTRLSWSPGEYSGINEIYVDKELLWFPAFDVINTVESVDLPGSGQARIFSSGTVTSHNHLPVQVFCDINIEFYPYDIQKCRISVRLSHLDKTQMVIRELLQGVWPKHLEGAGGQGWRIISVETSYGGHHSYVPEEAPFSIAVLEIIVSRKPTNYVYYVLLPCAVVSFLITLGFLMPSKTSEKVTYNLMILLGYSVFQSFSAEVPITSGNIPKMTKLISGAKIYATVAIVFSVFILRIHHHGAIATDSPPPLIMNICRRYIRKIVMMADIVSLEEHDEQNVFKVDFVETSTNQERIWSRNISSLERESTFNENDTHQLVKDLVDKRKREERRGIRELEWNFLSLVLSRFLFLLFSIVYCICCVTYWYTAMYNR